MKEETSLADTLDSAFDESMADTQDTTEAQTDAEPSAETTESEPAKDEAAPVDESAEAPAEDDSAEDALLKLSPEELAAIKSNPATAKLYKSVMRSATQKWQEIAEHRKLWEALQNDPENAIKALAAAKGLRIADEPQQQAQQQAASQAADDLESEWAQVVGAEAAALLRPLIEKTALRAAQGSLQPVQQATQALQLDAKARQAQAQIATFKANAQAKGWDITPEVEARMTTFGQQVFPSRQLETVEDGVKHLEMLYRLATADDADAKAEARVLARMKKAAQSAEPSRSVSSAGRGSTSRITDEMDLNAALEVAVDEAVSESR